MSIEYAADDYAAIAAKMKELKEPPMVDLIIGTPVCGTCGGHGFVPYGYTTSGLPLMGTCPKCRNPHGLSCP